MSPALLRLKFTTSLTGPSKVYRNWILYEYDYFTFLVEFYIEQGMEISLTDLHGSSLIHYASQIPSPNLLNVLVKHGGEGFVNQVDIHRSTPLHYAVFANNFNGIQFLLENGCNKDMRDCKGRTAANLAKILGYADTAQLIGGCDDEEKTPPFVHPKNAKKL
ncbi:hypothetical protein CAPTEDRAFT_95474, partial [Capitella teleta]